MLYELGVQHPRRPLHFAITREIVNSPNGPYPNEIETIPPNGSHVRLVELGSKIPTSQYSPKQWWPTAEDEPQRCMLFFQILREGWLLPNYVAICLAILAEFYTTTSSSSSIPHSSATSGNTRIRLHSFGSPISDFGIAKGKALVNTRNCLVYRDQKTGKITQGQDPNEHYWIYFRTLKGEEYSLDCGLFTFNWTAVLEPQLYENAIPDHHLYPLPMLIPAFFTNNTVPNLISEHAATTQRFSVLRDTSLHKAVRHNKRFVPEDFIPIFKFMEQATGRKCTYTERELTTELLGHHRRALSLVLSNRSWVNLPKEARLLGDLDLSFFNMGEVGQQVRRYNRGEASGDHVIRACLEYELKARLAGPSDEAIRGLKKMLEDITRTFD